MSQHTGPYMIPGGDSPYQGRHHWDMQKQEMLQGLIESGMSPEEAEGIVTQITNLQRGAGNIPQGHQDQYAAGEAPEDDILMAQENMAFTPGIPSPTQPQMASPQMAGVGGVGGAEGIGPSGPLAPPPEAGSKLPPDIFDQLGPEGIEQLMKMGGLQEQLGHAQSLRSAKSPQGRYVSNGRVYVAGSGLEHAVSGYGKYKGTKDVKRIQKEQAAGRTSIIDLLRNKSGQTPPILGPGVGIVA